MIVKVDVARVSDGTVRWEVTLRNGEKYEGPVELGPLGLTPLQTEVVPSPQAKSVIKTVVRRFEEDEKNRR